LASPFADSDQAPFVQRVGGGQRPRHLLDAGRAFGIEIAGRAVAVMPRLLLVKAAVPIRVVADRLGRGAAAEPVAPADLDRLA